MKIYANPSDNPNQETVKSENPNAFSDSLTNPTEKEKLKDLHGQKKIQYIWDYYKIPILIGVAILLAVIYTVYARTHTKDTLMCVTCVNVDVENEVQEDLTNTFVSEYLNLNPSKYQVLLDTNLTVGDAANSLDPQYAYSAQMKLVAFITSGQMDVVVMNQDSFDYLSQSGFLEDLTDVFTDTDSELNILLKDKITENIMVLEDNASEVEADPSIEYYSITETHPFGVKLDGNKFFSDNFSGQDIYIGIAVNSTKKAASMQYIRYLFELEAGDFAVLPEK